jgi:hypothetical protein
MEIGAARSLRLGLPLLHHTPRRTERVDPHRAAVRVGGSEDGARTALTSYLGLSAYVL